MEQIVLKTTDEWKFGQTNSVPYLGVIEISEQGKIFVNSDLIEKAKLLVDCNINFFFDEEIKPQTREEDDLSKKKEDKDPIKPQVTESEPLESTVREKRTYRNPYEETEKDKEIDAFAVEIMSKKMAELTELCIQANFPKKEWTWMVRSELRRYLIKKLREQCHQSL